jgi:hypothetical protein
VRFSSPLALALLAVALTAASPARADDSETFFAQGRTLRAQAKCAEAIVAFRRALEVKPLGLGALRNVAECEEELGEFASARADWWSLRRAVLQSSEPKYDGWDKHAEKAYNRLEAKVAHITVKVAGPSPERARVLIDGKPLDPRLVGVELERDLGPHTVEALYGGAAPVTDKRSLGIGAHEVVTLTLPAPKAGDAPKAGGTPPADAKPEGGGRALRVAGIGALTVGGLGAIGAIVSVIVRQGALSSFASCAPSYTHCPNTGDLQSALTRGQTASTLVNVFSVVAVAGIGAGIPLVVVGARAGAPAPGAAPSDPPAPSAASARAVIGLVPLLGGAAVHAGVRF